MATPDKQRKKTKIEINHACYFASDNDGDHVDVHRGRRGMSLLAGSNVGMNGMCGAAGVILFLEGATVRAECLEGGPNVELRVVGKHRGKLLARLLIEAGRALRRANRRAHEKATK
jgi:hypothetical protein